MSATLNQETLHVEEAQKSYGGGKGANQAIATARMKADTTFISKVGNDGLAQFMFEDFKAAGMNIDYILESETEKDWPSLYYSGCTRSKYDLCLWWCKYGDDTRRCEKCESSNCRCRFHCGTIKYQFRQL